MIKEKILFENQIEKMYSSRKREYIKSRFVPLYSSVLHFDTPVIIVASF